MEEPKQGAFLDSLKRNNKQIRDDRASAIAEDAQLLYRRRVEDLELQITRLRRDQENMLDLSPDNAHSLKLASDFKGNEYVDKDLSISVNIRNLEIQLELAKARYEYLFGAK
jgi:hypothetical protein